MAEGLVLLDVDGDIGHANGSFERIVDVESGSLLGQPIDGFDWALSGDFGLAVMPWIQCLEEQQQVCGAILDLTTNNQPMRTFIVNATPIVSDGDECRGVLVSFEDVTALEKKKLELSQVIKTLRQSRDEVTRQNERLNYLASFDQLTNCLNRREFFMRFENSWSADENEFLSVIMLDVDHFKSVNDNHGHGAGDEVLRKVSGILIDSIGDRGVVARLGGEEFAALLPKVELQAAELIAEEIRRNIAEAPIEGLKVTITAGVSSREMKPIDWQHLLDQADQALYVGKKRGRNCVESFASLNDPKRVCRQPANAKSEMAAEEVVATQLIDEIGSMLDPLTQRQAEPTTTSQPATKASSPLNSTGR